MLPSIGVPTTAGTGSEAQACALIADDESHLKMACGDRGRAAFRVGDTRPRGDAHGGPSGHRVTGIDALAHAPESYVCHPAKPALPDVRPPRLAAASTVTSSTHAAAPARPAGPRRDAAGGSCLRAAWRSRHQCWGYCRFPRQPAEAAHYGLTHGKAVGVMLPHVVRWNSRVAADRYAELAGVPRRDAPARVARRRGWKTSIAAGGFPGGLCRRSVCPERDLPDLATAAAEQWTGRVQPADVRRRGRTGDLRCGVLIDDCRSTVRLVGSALTAATDD